MKKRNNLLNYFARCLRFNLTLAVVLAVVFAIIHSFSLMLESKISPSMMMYLLVFMSTRTLNRFLLVGLILAAAVTLLFGFRNRREVPWSSVILREVFTISVATMFLIVIKKYYPDLLLGPFAYVGFYASHWVKENTLLFCGLLITGIVLSYLSVWRPQIIRFFSLKIFFACLAVCLFANGIYLAATKVLQDVLIERDVPNVILLTVDTLRADHMSIYGYPRQTTPHLDRLGQESAVFKNAIASWPKTNQSFASILTGRYRQNTGMGTLLASFLPRHNFLISEVLKNAGYRTAGLVSNSNLSRYFHFADGFDEYIELWAKRKGPARERSWYEADLVTQEATRWLEKHAGQKFFLWIHYIDPHTKYEPPPPYNALFVNDSYYDRYENLPFEDIKETTRLGGTDPDFYVAQYDGEIRFTDDQIQKVLEKIDQLGLRDNTLLIFTADHGESFVENRFYFDHGKYPYENCARVPLFVRFPRKIFTPRTFEEAVSLTDIFPTVLHLLDLRLPARVDGYSLKSALTSGEWNRSYYVFIESGDYEHKYQKTVRTKEWKLIYVPDARDRKTMSDSVFELFNVAQDPLEQVNLASQNLPVQKQLAEALFQWMRGSGGTLRQVPRRLMPSELDPATLEQLRSLGYVQ